MAPRSACSRAQGTVLVPNANRTLRRVPEGLRRRRALRRRRGRTATTRDLWRFRPPGAAVPGRASRPRPGTGRPLRGPGREGIGLRRSSRRHRGGPAGMAESFGATPVHLPRTTRAPGQGAHGGARRGPLRTRGRHPRRASTWRAGRPQGGHRLGDRRPRSAEVHMGVGLTGCCGGERPRERDRPPDQMRCSPPA
jgi:hypothetical protein